MATSQNDKPVDNGVNVEALFGAQAALKDAPEAAKFKWRSTVEWINGTHSRSTIESFYGLGAEQKHKKKFTFDADHPEVFAAEDHSATPVEIVLAGLASCLTAAWPLSLRRAKSNCVPCRRRSRREWTSAASSVWTRTCATASTASR